MAKTAMDLIEQQLKQVPENQRAAEQATMRRLIESDEFRSAYVRGVGAGSRELTPTEAWAIETGLYLDSQRQSGGKLARQEVAGTRFSANQQLDPAIYKHLQGLMERGPQVAGYNFPAGGRVGQGYTYISGGPGSALSDALMK